MPNSGIHVPMSPRFFQMRNCGTIVTAPGSIIVASTRPNRIRRPGNRKYAKPNATSALEIDTSAAESSAIARLLPIQPSSGSCSHTST